MQKQNDTEQIQQPQKNKNQQSQPVSHMKVPFHPTPSNTPLRGKLKDLGKYEFSFEQKLGSGLTSDAYLGRNKQTQELVCVKIVDLLNFKNESQRLLLDNEIQCQKKLNSENIIKVLDIYDTNSFCFIVTELCQDGDLFKLIKFSMVGLPELLVVRFAKNLASALVTLKENKIIHRDIKSENILLSEGKAKLGDFGFSIQQKNLKEKQVFNLGSPIYMPLEALENNRYGYQSDIFSFGIVLYEMLHIQSPWQCSDQVQLISRMKSQQISFKSGVSQKMKELIKSCLEKDYKKRATIEDVMEKLEKFSGQQEKGEQTSKVSLCQ